MRPDIEEYLREQGWVFAGVSQPDHKRQWAQMDGNKVKRVALESELGDLVIEIVNSPLQQEQPDVNLEKEIDNYLSCSEDIEECADNERYYVTKSALLSMARYFFIHGSLNARKKE